VSKSARASTLPPINTFADAMSQLMAFEAEFGPMQGALVVDGNGAVVDGVVLTLTWHTVDHALTYVLLGARGPGEFVLLFSVMGDVDIRLLGESDVEAYDALQARCDNAGVQLSDWLIAGGDHFRSMQLATSNADKRDPATAWRLGR
jgi:hypothetical protein